MGPWSFIHDNTTTSSTLLLLQCHLISEMKIQSVLSEESAPTQAREKRTVPAPAQPVTFEEPKELAAGARALAVRLLSGRHAILSARSS